MSKVIEDKWVTAIQSKNIVTLKYDKPATINWSGVGAVDVDTAREFANRILKVCDRVEKGDFDYE